MILWVLLISTTLACLEWKQNEQFKETVIWLKKEEEIKVRLCFGNKVESELDKTLEIEWQGQFDWWQHKCGQFFKFFFTQVCSNLIILQSFQWSHTHLPLHISFHFVDTL